MQECRFLHDVSDSVEPILGSGFKSFSAVISSFHLLMFLGSLLLKQYGGSSLIMFIMFAFMIKSYLK